MLVNAKAMLEKALKEGYAVPAYNINNLEWARFILEACNEDNSPVILEATEKAVDYFGGYKVVYNVVKSLIEELNIKVPVVLHLDHATSFDSCKKAIDAGFTSVMIDLSSSSFDENTDITSKVVNYAKIKDVSVEAELGSLTNDGHTSVEEASDFVSITGIDFLAPSVGNYHGIYKEMPELDFKLLGLICKTVKMPLVLHGASGLDDNKIKTAIFCGVSKININTDLMLAWQASVREYLDYNKDEYDPRKIILSGKKSLKKVVHSKNELLGSKNKA